MSHLLHQDDCEKKMHWSSLFEWHSGLKQCGFGKDAIQDPKLVKKHRVLRTLVTRGSLRWNVPVDTRATEY